jgi:hypothetical protein
MSNMNSLSLHEIAAAMEGAVNRINHAKVICANLYDVPYAGRVKATRFSQKGTLQLNITWDEDGTDEWVDASEAVITQHGPAVNLETIAASVRAKFETLEDITRGVGEGYLSGCIISGRGGVGKTETVERTLQVAMGLTDDEREQDDLRAARKERGERTWTKVTGHMSPMAMYELLYEHRTKEDIVIFDDTDSVFADQKSLNLLKAALDTRRFKVLSWGTKSLQLQVPQSFRFEGQIVFLTNKVLHGEHFEAMLTRIHHLDMSLTTQEILYRISDLAQTVEHWKAEPHHREEAVAFLSENIDRFDKLNVRTFLKLLDYRVMDKEDTGRWRDRAAHLLFTV